MHELLTNMIHKRYVRQQRWRPLCLPLRTLYCLHLTESNCLTELLLESAVYHVTFYFSALSLRLQVYPLHSSVTLEEQNNVFLSPVPGYRKVGRWEGEV